MLKSTSLGGSRANLRDSKFADTCITRSMELTVDGVTLNHFILIQLIMFDF